MLCLRSARAAALLPRALLPLVPRSPCRVDHLHLGAAEIFAVRALHTSPVLFAGRKGVAFSFQLLKTFENNISRHVWLTFSIFCMIIFFTSFCLLCNESLALHLTSPPNVSCMRSDSAKSYESIAAQ